MRKIKQEHHQVIYDLYLQGVPQSQIARQFGVVRQRIHQIIIKKKSVPTTT